MGEVERTLVSVILVCDHENLYSMSPPTRGEIVYCFKCDDWKAVATGKKMRQRSSYKLVCRNCDYVRHPPSMQGLMAQGRLHATKHYHTVESYDPYDELVMIIEPESDVIKP